MKNNLQMSQKKKKKKDSQYEKKTFTNMREKTDLLG